jgi:cysteinyl-tRNA synthetase
VIEQVKMLIAKGNVYRIEDDGWYFDLTTFPDYGKLSGRTALEAEDAVSRIDDSSKKRNAGDFCVWKLSKPGDPSWDDAQLGTGRPGWHIEDTAITEAAFGPQYDLHGGAIDLKFPHHEAEIAQQEAASGKVPFVKYWAHAGFLQVHQARMGKSVGNMMPVREALKRWSPEALRFFLLSGHYRAPLEFSEQALDAAEAAVQRIYEAVNKVNNLEIGDGGDDASVRNAVAQATQDLARAMDDDFNVPEAFAAIFEAIKAVNIALVGKNVTTTAAGELRVFFALVSKLFNIIPANGFGYSSDVLRLVNERQTARDRKDFAEADRIRDQLAQMGYSVDDTPYGPLVKQR